MQQILPYIQIIIAILLIISILIQNRGSGLGGVFGGEGNVFRTKRGAEKIIFYLTIVCACLFFLVGFIRLVI
jgi:preprotein translocase subunit SecG